jgi:hypothetical protein
MGTDENRQGQSLEKGSIHGMVALMVFIASGLLLPDANGREHPYTPERSGSHLIHIRQGESIQEAIQGAEAGDTLLLEDGIYYEKISIEKPLTLMALNPGEVTITNQYSEHPEWIPTETGQNIWCADGIDWPVIRLLVEGVQAFDFRNKYNFDHRLCGPYWSKGWQKGRYPYPDPTLSFAWDSSSQRIWLRLGDDRDPNLLDIAFNGRALGDTTYIQKDLGAYWNQQEIVRISAEPSEDPVTMWYGGTPEHPKEPRHIYIPRACGIVINIRSDHVTLDGLRIHMGPTVCVEVNNSSHVTLRDCYFSGYQYGINTGYACTGLTVVHCEFDGGQLLGKANHTRITENMWNHSTYVVPVRFNGTGLRFHHNYVYEGFDLFQPRGRHRDFSHVPGLGSDVAYNVWQQAMDNNIEFDGVEARIRMRFHHNLVIGRNNCDMLAITTTEQGDPLLIDHNLFWDGRTHSRIMKLTGTGRMNDGVQFIHNTYYTGDRCSFAEFGAESVFENNIVLTELKEAGCWTHTTLGNFFPSRFNLIPNGDRFMAGFEGLTSEPMLGTDPENRFCLQPGSPAIDAGIWREGYFNNTYEGSRPDLGALESSEDVESWRTRFGHCGPTWINSANARSKAPNRPPWPKDLDRRWGGLD